MATSDDGGLDVTRDRSPSELRQLLEVRVRRQADSYSPAVRRQALQELRDLADAALQQLDADEPDG